MDCIEQTLEVRAADRAVLARWAERLERTAGRAQGSFAAVAVGADRVRLTVRCETRWCHASTLRTMARLMRECGGADAAVACAWAARSV